MTMFTIKHFIWLAICAFVVAIASVQLRKRRVDLTKLLTIACAVGIASELIKTFSAFQMVPSTD